MIKADESSDCRLQRKIVAATPAARILGAFASRRGLTVRHPSSTCFVLVCASWWLVPLTSLLGNDLPFGLEERTLDLDEMGIVRVKPSHGGFFMPSVKIVAPGDPFESGWKGSGVFFG